MTPDKTIRQKHIAMYIGSLNKGGAERVMCNLAEFFYGAGYKVTLVTTYLSDDEYELPHGTWSVVSDGRATGDKSVIRVLNPDEDIRYVEMEGSTAPGIRRVFTALMPDETGGRVANFRNRLMKLKNVWRDIKPDLILSFLGKNNCMAIASAKGTGIPVVVSVRATPSMEYDTKGLRLAQKCLFPGAAGVVLQTNGAKEFFSKKVRKKSIVLPNAVNEAFLTMEPVPFEDRSKTIVSVGRLDDNKNQKLLIEAFAQIADTYPDYKLVLYGDGPAKQELCDMAEPYGDMIVFAGSVSNVAERISGAEIFVLPSLTEGMPNALIEAMALGLACVSTDCPCGGPADLIQNGENGILIPMSSNEVMRDDLANALEILITDRDNAAAMAERALLVRDRFRPEVINGRWKEYFDGLMDRY